MRCVLQSVSFPVPHVKRSVFVKCCYQVFTTVRLLQKLMFAAASEALFCLCRNSVKAGSCLKCRRLSCFQSSVWCCDCQAITLTDIVMSIKELYWFSSCNSNRADLTCSDRLRLFIIAKDKCEQYNGRKNSLCEGL